MAKNTERFLKSRRVDAIILEIKKEVFDYGDTFCQRCRKVGPVDAAHAKKRAGFDPKTNERWLPTEDGSKNEFWWYIVAFLCRDCHEKIEHMTGEDPNARMEAIVVGLFERYNKGATVRVLKRKRR